MTMSEAVSRFQVWRRKRHLAKEARLLLGEARRMLRTSGWRLAEGSVLEVRGAIVELEAALELADYARVREAVRAVEQVIERHLTFARKSTFREYAESIGVAVLVALFLRSFVVEAFKIPSGSMIPTLEVGDHIFVNKYLYGVRIPGTDFKFFERLRPQRGEVVVFRFPNPSHLASEEDKDFIKRIVAVEGDVVEVRNRALHVNGKPVPRVDASRSGACTYQDILDETSGVFVEKSCEAYRETLGSHAYTVFFEPGGSAPRSFAPHTVAPGTVFAMGDNRDNSHDSRYWGGVPTDLIKGRAMFIWLSSKSRASSYPWPISFLADLRWERMFRGVP
jgi:signal peptidase I